MNILFVTLPYYGHLVPTLGLLGELGRIGCPLPSGWEDPISGSGAERLLRY